VNTDDVIVPIDAVVSTVAAVLTMPTVGAAEGVDITVGCCVYTDAVVTAVASSALVVVCNTSVEVTAPSVTPKT